MDKSIIKLIDICVDILADLESGWIANPSYKGEVNRRRKSAKLKKALAGIKSLTVKP